MQTAIKILTFGEKILKMLNMRNLKLLMVYVFFLQTILPIHTDLKKFILRIFMRQGHFRSIFLQKCEEK